MDITWVCFDIGGVASGAPFDDVVEYGKACFGQKYDLAKFKKMMRCELNGSEVGWNAFQLGLTPVDSYLRRAVEYGGMKPTRENVQSFKECLELFSSDPYQPMLELHDRLKDNGLYTAVLSNNNELMYNQPGAVLGEKVDVALYSHQIHAVKPDDKAFEALFDELDVDPSQILLIDDGDKNVKVAKYLGMQAFHYRSAELGMDAAYGELENYLGEREIL